MAQVPPEVVPELCQLLKVETTNPTGEKEERELRRTAESGSSGIIGTGVAGPSNTTPSTPFTYSQAQNQEIWEHACDKDYFGAHARFDPRAQVNVIDGEAKGRQYLDAHPEIKTRLRTPTDGNPRRCLYICGESAIWRVVGDQTNGATTTPQYELTYEPCHDSAYATMDNYKNHVYRHHLGKVYKQYARKGKGRA